MEVAAMREQVKTRAQRFFEQEKLAYRRPVGWRHPLVGYIVAIGLVGLCLTIGLVEARLSSPFAFPGVPLLFSVVLVALLWGVLTAAFAILLSLMVLDYLYIPPFGTLGTYGWEGWLQLFTFTTAGIVITMLAAQREAARVRAIRAEQEARKHAHQVETTMNTMHELALREANKQMEDFVSVICHELKTPLTVMKGNLQLAERKLQRLYTSESTSSHKDEERRLAPVQHLLERAHNQITLQDRLVNDLLDASRLQKQTLNFYMAPCKLDEIVQEAVEDQRQIVSTRTIRLELEKEEVLVQGDADRLVQVVTNYLTNAHKYSPLDRPITVRMQVTGKQARVSVQDEGAGIPASETERIWQRFYRAETSVANENDRQHVGLGIGLHLSRTIIEQHGGKVGVESKMGWGSCFWFTLPVINVDANGLGEG